MAAKFALRRRSVETPSACTPLTDERRHMIGDFIVERDRRVVARALKDEEEAVSGVLDREPGRELAATWAFGRHGVTTHRLAPHRQPTA